MNHQRGEALARAVVYLPGNPAALLVLQLEQTTGEIAERLFRIFARSDISVDFEDPNHSALLVTLQHLAACHNDSFRIFCEMNQLTFPPTSAEKLFMHLLERLGKLGAQKVMRYISTGFCGRPTVGLLRSSVPEQNHAIRVADDNCIMRELQ